MVSIPFKSGKYSNNKTKFANAMMSSVMSQSLLNQGNIQIGSPFSESVEMVCQVSIPFKSGKYSNVSIYTSSSLWTDSGLNPF